MVWQTGVGIVLYPLSTKYKQSTIASFLAYVLDQKYDEYYYSTFWSLSFMVRVELRLVLMNYLWPDIPTEGVLPHILINIIVSI